MTTSNVIPLTDAEFRRRCSKMSSDLFGFGYDVEADRQQLISDAMNLAHLMNYGEISRLLNELHEKMTAIARMHKVKS